MQPNVIVVLAGGIKQNPEKIWMSTDLTESDDRQGAPGAKLRVHAAAILAGRSPNAVVMASGGKGYDVPSGVPENRPLLAEILRDELLANGVSQARIILEDKSNTTYQQLGELQKAIIAQRWTDVVIVTNRWHMTRVKAMIQSKFQRMDEHVCIISAEEVLLDDDRNRWENIFARAYESDFLRKRMEREAEGVRQIRDGRYNFK
jgi:uncharacterized SAM-binding protein YcdF (DUF218 family)